ncbi:phospholipase A2 inhibitor and Ly6/PLAUR domain-containing protein-like [Anomaloglossus baeobatrachus]|uniref:phospholipase A2 inhibitor and Ly6/PLAUR domain-containing protein-like n=1 Tax=Anomaloglossus baeobatrachus TaxID=238106 RepID=UPI003F4FD408
MKNLVAFLYILSALVISVFSHKCYSCVSSNSTTCNQTEIECLGPRCMTASQYFILNGTLSESMFKGCANETLCKDKGMGKGKNTEYQFSSECCTGTLCNKDTFEHPKENVTENGVKCPCSLCIGTLEECKTDEMINCTGSMDRCVDYRATVRDQYGRDANYSCKGCANSDGCKFNFYSKILFEEMHREMLKC